MHILTKFQCSSICSCWDIQGDTRNGMFRDPSRNRSVSCEGDQYGGKISWQYIMTFDNYQQKHSYKNTCIRKLLKYCFIIFIHIWFILSCVWSSLIFFKHYVGSWLWVTWHKTIILFKLAKSTLQMTSRRGMIVFLYK